jgi:hypothetical protein
LSSDQWCSAVEYAVEVAGEVALERPGGVATAFAFGDAAGDVVLRSGVVLASVEDHGVQGAVELAVAATTEPMPIGLSARGGDRCDAGESCEGGFGADASVV